MQIKQLILICCFVSFYQINYQLNAAIRSMQTTPTITPPAETIPSEPNPSNVTPPTIPASTPIATTSPTSSSVGTSNSGSSAEKSPLPVTSTASVHAPSTISQTDTPPSPLFAPIFTTIPTNTVATPVTPPSTPVTTATSSTTVTPATQEPTNTSTVPTPPAPIKQFLTSIYIQNNFPKEAVLDQIDLLVDNETTPVIKSNLNITIPGVKNLYSKGSIIGFDITSPGKNINNFNGISSITINNDKINFTNIKTGYGIGHPIKITQKNGHWVADK